MLLGSRELSPRNRFPGHSSLGTRSPLPTNYGVFFFFIWSLSNLSLLAHFWFDILFSPMFCLKKISIVGFKGSWVYLYNWDIFEAVVQYWNIVIMMLYVSKVHLHIKQTLQVSITYFETFGHTTKFSWNYEDYAYTRYFFSLAKMVKIFY